MSSTSRSVARSSRCRAWGGTQEEGPSCVWRVVGQEGRKILSVGGWSVGTWIMRTGRECGLQRFGGWVGYEGRATTTTWAPNTHRQACVRCAMSRYRCELGGAAPPVGSRAATQPTPGPTAGRHACPPGTTAWDGAGARRARVPWRKCVILLRRISKYMGVGRAGVGPLCLPRRPVPEQPKPRHASGCGLGTGTQPTATPAPTSLETAETLAPST